MEVDVTGQAISGTLATEPAFDVLVDAATGDLLVTGVPGLGDFQLVATPQNNIPEQEEDVTAAVEVTDERPYLADNYNLVFSSDTFDPINISVPFTGDASKTAEAIAEAIASDETLSQSIRAFVTGADLTFRAKEQGFDFTVQLAELDGLQDLHNQENNQTKISTIPEFQPSSRTNQTADVGVATVVSLENLPNTETVFSFYGENNLLSTLLIFNQ